MTDVDKEQINPNMSGNSKKAPKLVEKDLLEESSIESVHEIKDQTKDDEKTSGDSKKHEIKSEKEPEIKSEKEPEINSAKEPVKESRKESSEASDNKEESAKTQPDVLEKAPPRDVEEVSERKRALASSTSSEEEVPEVRSSVKNQAKKRLKKEVKVSQKEETRKRKPSESDQQDDRGQESELPKRLKQGISSESKFEDVESEILTPQDPKQVPKFADLVHSPKPELCGSILEITRGHDPITEALPSSSVHGSQEDLSSIDGVYSDAIRPVIDDVSKLRQDQQKSLNRAKALLAAAFSEEDDDDSDEDDEPATNTNMDQISGVDADMS